MNNRFLPMLEVDQQVLCHASVNAAYTRVCSTGVEDATLTAFNNLMEHWSRTALNDSFHGYVDALDPRMLGPTILMRISGALELSETSLEPKEIRKHLDLLNGLRAHNPSRAFRNTVNRSDEAASEVTRQLRKSLHDAFTRTPHRVREVVEQTRQMLANIRLPEPSPEPLVQLARIVRGLEEVATRRTAFTVANHDTVIAQLTHRVQQVLDEAMRCVAMEFAVDSFRRAVEEVNGYLDELLVHGNDFLENVQAIRDCLQRRQKAAAEDNEISRASVILPLQGPDEKDVLAGMVAHQDCSDFQALSVDMMARFETRLRDLAIRRYAWIEASDSSLARLLAAIDPLEAAHEFAQVAEDSLGAGHTLYQLIEQLGIDRCAQELYLRAGHTCHLRGRDNDRFNIPTVELSIVRMPPAIGHADFAIRNRLASAFEDLGDCTITDGSENARDVHIVRLHLGWPIAIEQNNAALLARYISSEASGHRPHLLGIVDDSPAGEVSPSYVKLSDKQ